MLTNTFFVQAADKYRDTVFRVAFNYMKNQADADDITQGVFLKLLKCDVNFENDNHLKHWLIRVTINECKSIFRAPWRKVENIEDYAGQLCMPSPKHTELFETVMAMPEKYRIVIYLYYYEEYRTEEIAGFLKVPPATVRTRLARGRKKLKGILEEENYYD